MKSNTIYVVLGILACVGILSASISRPIYAVSKVEEVRLQKQEFVSNTGFAFPLCGVTDSFTLDITLRNYHFIGYSDGTYKVTSVTEVEYYDSNGKLVASSPQTQLYGDATSHNQFNVLEVCKGQGGTSQNFHYGYTISEGVIKEIHLVSMS